MADSSGNAGPSNTGQTPKVIPSLAKKQSDVTRLGTQKLKFVPTLPARRKKEDAKPEPATPAPSAPARGSGRGRGSDRGGRGRGRGGSAAEARLPAVEMTASGPFAMGPSLAGKAGSSSGPRSNFTPVVPGGPGASAKLGAGLTQSAAPTLGGGVKREGEINVLKRAEESKAEEDEEQVYSDQEDGVEIVDIEKVRMMDWMAPESLKRERDAKHKKKAKKEDAKGKGIAASSNEMEVDDDVVLETNEKVNLANAIDLSESEDEEELEDIVDDFAPQDAMQDDPFAHHDRLFFFQFPEPFPTFVSKSKSDKTPSIPTVPTPNDKGKGVDRERKVSFAENTKPPGPSGPPTNGAIATESKEIQEDPKVDGVVGQLEIYQSGAVKMRMGNGIVYDVTAATQPSFLQHAVYLDADKKQLCVLGEINRRFVVSPDLEVLLAKLAVGEEPAEVPGLLGAGLISMDTS
ncbi:hypothetical protein QCA50_010627 [Cerrena zonata]|uniref:DNA-directed RNA polymerase III subunit RPC4 n=1 Tax=Cerrena zonata TaxID=2478898 RepID=A0AAW0G8X0_9APHY